MFFEFMLLSIGFNFKWDNLYLQGRRTLSFSIIMLTAELDNRQRFCLCPRVQTETPRSGQQAASPHFFASPGIFNVTGGKLRDAGPELAYKWTCGK